MSDSKLFIRIKRKHETFCLLCEPTDTILSLKQRVGAMIRQHQSTGTNGPQPIDDDEAMEATAVDENQMRFLQPDQPALMLADKDSLRLLEIKNDAVLYLVLALSADLNEWEPVDIHSTELRDTA